jgi:flagellar biosynthesis protein FlhG
MYDQAEKLRQLAGTAPPPARTVSMSPPLVVLTGGTSGVGTTTLTINLGAALADAGLRVVIVDAARSNANLTQVAGIHADDANKLSDVLAGDRAIGNALQPGPAGTLLLSDRPGERMAGEFTRHGQQRLLSAITSLRTETDCVLIDAGSGMTAWTRRFWQHASLMLAVTTPHDAAIVDTYALIKLALTDQPDADVRVVVNRCDAPTQADDAHRRLSAACERFLGRAVPAAPSLPQQSPITTANGICPPRLWELPDTPFGHAVLWLARAVADLLPVEPHHADDSRSAPLGFAARAAADHNARTHVRRAAECPRFAGPAGARTSQFFSADSSPN